MKQKKKHPDANKEQQLRQLLRQRYLTDWERERIHQHLFHLAQEQAQQRKQQ